MSVKRCEECTKLGAPDRLFFCRVEWCVNYYPMTEPSRFAYNGVKN